MTIENTEKYHFLLEESCIPIYQRIIKGFCNALGQAGHKVSMLNAAGSVNASQLLNSIRSQDITHCLITNPGGFLSAFADNLNRYIFELIEPQIIFVHHDNIFSSIDKFDHIKRKIEAFQNIKDKSIHFCIEYYNFLDLKMMGIDRVYTISHATEFEKKDENNEYSCDVSFVGHILPRLNGIFDACPCSHLLQRDYWNRIVCLNSKNEASAEYFADSIYAGKYGSIEWFTAKYNYISMIHMGSQFFRGEIIKRTGNFNIDIFGGDPAYLHGYSIERKLKKKGLTYHPPTSDYSKTQDIYRNSRINLNVSALQFDDAVINRVIDAGAAGGFVLTDFKSDLKNFTSVYREISYSSIDELNEKIAYYLSNEKERCEIAEQLHKDIMNQYTYPHVVNKILTKVSNMSLTECRRIDLGCGPRKAQGFIGVDIVEAPGVDVVADLTKRFPYPDNSIEEIRAHDIVEHLPDRIQTMNEIWRICKPGSRVDIRVPSTDGRGAFQDPTHVSFWNINSFKYYCIEFPAFIELCRAYGFKGKFKLLYLNHEKSTDDVIHVRAVLEVIK